MPLLKLQPFGATDPGKVRQNNEDALLVGDGGDETLFVVADGVGGFEAGEVASSIAVDVLRGLGPDDSFEGAIEEANRRILAAGRGDDRLSGMSTTVVAARFGGTRREPVVEVAHVGDSRAYLFRGGELKPVTDDHSLVAELVRSGDLTREQAFEHPQKNLITRALGTEDGVTVDTAVLPVEIGDRFVLCSDGLTDMVPDNRIAATLKEGPQGPEETAHRLLDAALEAGGADNITVVIVDVKELASDPEPPAERQQTGTQELHAIDPPTAAPEAPPEARSSETERRARGRVSSSERRKRGGGVGKKVGRVIRLLAAVAAVLLILSPAYFWGSSRYYLAFDDNEVVAYRGLPYAPFGVELNEEWRRPGLKRADVKEPYVERIESQQLNNKEQVENILRDLGRE